MASTIRSAVKKKTRVARARAQSPNLLQQMGVLRVVLVGAAVLDILLAPNPGTAVAYNGWALVTTLIVPVLAPILLQVLLLDALMAKILMSSNQGAERARFRRIMFVDLVIAAVLVLGWTPYFLALGR